jgi:hypothetical protein
MIDLHDVLMLDSTVEDYPDGPFGAAESDLLPQLQSQGLDRRQAGLAAERWRRLERLSQVHARQRSDSEKLADRAQQWQAMMQLWIRPQLIAGKDRLEMLPNGTLVASLTAEGHAWLDRFLALQLAERKLITTEVHLLSGPKDVISGLFPRGKAEFLTTEERDQLVEKARRTEKVEVVLAPKLLLFERSRVNISVYDEIEYVKDWSVHTVEPGKRKIAVPTLDTVADGVSVTMRCVTLEGGQYGVEMNLQRSKVAQPLRTASVHLDVEGGRDMELALPVVDTDGIKSVLALESGAVAVLESPTPDGSTMIVLMRVTKAK